MSATDGGPPRTIVLALDGIDIDGRHFPTPTGEAFFDPVRAGIATVVGVDRRGPDALMVVTGGDSRLVELGTEVGTLAPYSPSHVVAFIKDRGLVLLDIATGKADTIFGAAPRTHGGGFIASNGSRVIASFEDVITGSPQWTSGEFATQSNLWSVESTKGKTTWRRLTSNTSNESTGDWALVLTPRIDEQGHAWWIREQGNAYGDRSQFQLSLWTDRGGAAELVADVPLDTVLVDVDATTVWLALSVPADGNARRVFSVNLTTGGSRDLGCSVVGLNGVDPDTAAGPA
jgi:hypothetical protein